MTWFYANLHELRIIVGSYLSLVACGYLCGVIYFILFLYFDENISYL